MERTKFNLKNFQYKRMLEERRGYNFEYWSDKHDKMLENGWDIFEFQTSGRQWGMVFKKEATSSVSWAKEAVEKLRLEGNFARIVCGYEKNAQREKMYTVIFKPKGQLRQPV